MGTSMYTYSISFAGARSLSGTRAKLSNIASSTPLRACITLYVASHPRGNTRNTNI